MREREVLRSTMSSRSRVSVPHPEMTKESSFKRIKSDSAIKMRRGGALLLDLSLFFSLRCQSNIESHICMRARVQCKFDREPVWGIFVHYIIYCMHDAKKKILTQTQCVPPQLHSAVALQQRGECVWYNYWETIFSYTQVE